MTRSHRAAALLSAAALLATTAYVGLTASSAGAIQGCVPGENQVALFQGTNFNGRCAIFGKGAHPDVTAGAVSGSVTDNSVSSIKVGVHAAAVVHQESNFGGLFDNSWASFTSDVADLSTVSYPHLNDPPENGGLVDNTISSLWVLQQGCVPQGGQIAVFDLPSFGGACAIVKPGSYGSVVDAGFPNDFAGSLKTGGSAHGTIWLDAFMSSSTCDFFPGTNYSNICFGDDEASSLLVQKNPGG